MKRTYKKDTALKDEKHKALMEAYLEVIKSHGNDVKYISKTRLYEEAGEKVFLSAVYAGRIIRRMLRNGVKHCK